MAPGVRLEVRLLDQLLVCAGDGTGLEMALLNLCLNAGQATPGGGRVAVRARETYLRGSEAQRMGLSPGSYAAFTVRDTGVGMSAEILERATRPLFTTKSTGAGLGLSSVVDFAGSAGGALTLQSQEGRGTLATLYLPILRARDIAVAA